MLKKFFTMNSSAKNFPGEGEGVEQASYALEQTSANNLIPGH